jgi:hypothetical protein
MIARRASLFLCLGFVVLFGLVACGESGFVSRSAVPTADPLDDSGPMPGVVLATATPGNGTGNVVDATPMPPEVLTTQPPGSSDPGAGAGGGGAPPPNQEQPPQVGNMLTYTDDQFKFSVEYPADYVIRAQPESKLQAFSPVPKAAYRFLSPALAASQAPDEPGDLTIQIYAADGEATLQDWLKTNGLAPADGAALPEFKTPNATGVEVCSSSMLGPGCAYYFLGTGWVYQLTPASQVGEAMIQTFKMMP